METKEIRNMIPKFKKGSLYLYNPTNFHGRHYINVPVLSLCLNKDYPTWLCLFPNGRTGGCHPQHLKDITVKVNE